MATSTESMDELLQCSICLERFTSPKVLPCQHTFCLNCLRGITKGAHTLACPQCRKDHRLPTNGVVDFEDNLTIKTLLGLFVEAAACFDCSRMSSLSKCQHCAQEVCGDCRASHTKLVAEIDFVFRFIKSTTDDQCSDDSERNCANNVIWKDLLDRVVTERERVPVMFDHLERKLAKRKDSVLIFLEAMERRSRILVNQDKPRMVQAMTEQLDACQTTSQLKEFKHLLESTEGTLAAVLENGRGSDFEMSYDSEPVVTCFGNVSCGDTTIDVDIDEGRDGRTSHRSTSLLDSNRTSQRSNSSVQAGAENSELSELRRGLDRLTHEQQPAATGEADAKCNLPSNVNYKAKNSTMKIYIDRHPDDGKVLHPRYALYSTRLNSIFCLSGEPSKGQVIVYALDGSGGRTLSPLILAANHIAVSDSGKLIIAESSVITIVDMVASQGVKSKNALVRLELLEGISLASQVCCYLNEFVVLDSQQKCLMIFSEEGEFVREIVVGNVPELGAQKIAIDHEGCIYIHGGSRVVERKDVGEEKGCKHQRKLSSVTVQSVMFISVLTWDGTFSKIVELVCWPRRYDYKFNGETCCGVHTRNKKSVPTDEAIIKENSIRRFCVDSDGFICVTKMNYHVIEVYDQKGQLHCTIGDTNKGVAHGFSDPSGVSLMPGGRLIVCDTGNKRIQIL